jgi:hypothetical protein
MLLCKLLGASPVIARNFLAFKHSLKQAFEKVDHESEASPLVKKVKLLSIQFIICLLAALLLLMLLR